MSATTPTADLVASRDADSTGRPPRPPRRASRRAFDRSANTIERPRRSLLLTILMSVFLLYSFLPLAWLIISSTKTQESLIGSFGLWFSGPFAFFDNIVQTVTYDDGIFVRWFGNTLLYVIAGAGGATILATLAGYGLAKFTFPGKKAIFAVVLGAIAVPGTALAVPTFLMFSQMGLTNTIWAIIIPSAVSPFGVFLGMVYAQSSVPTELLEAARIDGAGEGRIFFTIVLRLLGPAMVTIFLFIFVATWNNFLLPLMMISSQDLKPVTLGLYGMVSYFAPDKGAVMLGALLGVIPLILLFFSLQKYWRSGLAAGAVKG